MADLNWVDAGASAMAIADHTLNLLIAKGVITPAEKLQVLDGAIQKLDQNPVLKQAADNIRLVFNRP